jgi:hypothetical protein
VSRSWQDPNEEAEERSPQDGVQAVEEVPSWGLRPMTTCCFFPLTNGVTHVFG